MAGQVLEQRQIIAAGSARRQDEVIEVRFVVGIAGRENLHLDIPALLGEIDSAGWLIR